MRLAPKDLSDRNIGASSDVNQGGKKPIEPVGKCLWTGRHNIDDVALAQGKIGLPAAFDGFEIRNKRGFVALWISAD